MEIATAKGGWLVETVGNTSLLLLVHFHRILLAAAIKYYILKVVVA